MEWLWRRLGSYLKKASGHLGSLLSCWSLSHRLESVKFMICWDVSESSKSRAAPSVKARQGLREIHWFSGNPPATACTKRGRKDHAMVSGVQPRVHIIRQFHSNETTPSSSQEFIHWSGPGWVITRQVHNDEVDPRSSQEICLLLSSRGAGLHSQAETWLWLSWRPALLQHISGRDWKHQAELKQDFWAHGLSEDPE